METKKTLFGKTLSELEQYISEKKFPKFTAKQIADWLYKKNISSINEMSNLSKKQRALLNEDFELGLNTPVKVQTSIDGTKKYLYQISDNRFIEAAYIPDKERATLCISSQVGCKMGCVFCMTAKQGFQQNLTSNEILNQIKSLPEFEKLTNIVYMGMGEPFDNTEEVLKSIEILSSNYGFGMSPRRITVSTIGIIPGMKQFLEQSDAHLALSLHTPFDNERRVLMPVETKYPLKTIMKELREWDFGRQRRISFEYIMFKGFNDTEKHAKELVRLLSGMKTRLNLIKYHAIPGIMYQGSSREQMEKFQNILKAKGIMTTIRTSRGEDIYAACGLLSTKEKNQNKETMY